MQIQPHHLGPGLTVTLAEDLLQLPHATMSALSAQGGVLAVIALTVSDCHIVFLRSGGCQMLVGRSQAGEQFGLLSLVFGFGKYTLRMQCGQALESIHDLGGIDA